MADNNSVVAGFDDDDESRDAPGAHSSAALQITLEKCVALDASLNVHLKGALDASNCVPFQRRVQKAFAAGYDFLTLEMGELSYLSSAGVGAMASLLKAAKERGGNVVLANVPSAARELLRVLNFEQFFKIEDSETKQPGVAASPRPVASTPPPYMPRVSAAMFPLVIKCPACQKALKVPKEGRYRCSGCKAILKVAGSGAVSLG